MFAECLMSIGIESIVEVQISWPEICDSQQLVMRAQILRPRLSRGPHSQAKSYCCSMKQYGVWSRGN